MVLDGRAIPMMGGADQLQRGDTTVVTQCACSGGSVDQKAQADEMHLGPGRFVAFV